MKKISLIILTLSSLLCVELRAFQPQGAPIITNFDYKTYEANSQNWGVAQDKQGTVFIGNNSGVLSYDGERWHLHRTSSIVRSLAYQEAENRLYVGLQGDLGYFEPNDIGKPVFHSLLSAIDTTHHDFADVWKVFTTTEGVFFQTSKIIFWWKNGQMHYLSPPTNTFHTMLYLSGQLYVKERGTGLLRLQGDSLATFEGTSLFANHIVFTLFEYDEEHVLVGTYNKGLFLWNTTANTLEPWKVSAGHFLKDGGLYHGIDLGENHPSGRYAFATLASGAVIMDKSGNISTHITEKQGLQNNRVKFAFKDVSNNLWLALNNGISQVNINSPIRHYGPSYGVSDKVYSTHLHQDSLLYAGFANGAYLLKEDTFRRIQRADEGRQVFGQTWCWREVEIDGNKQLLVGAQGGAFLVQGGFATIIADVNQVEAHHVFTIEQFPSKPNTLYLGTDYGLATLTWHKGKWGNLKMLDGLDREIRGIAKRQSSGFWLATYIDGLIGAEVSEEAVTDIILFDSLNSPLSSNRGTKVHEYRGETIFVNPNGIYTFSEEEQKFKPYRYFESWDFGEDYHAGFSDVWEEHLWVNLSHEESDITNDLGLYHFMNTPEGLKVDSALFKIIPHTEFINIKADSRQLWIASSDGIFTTAINNELYQSPSIKASIREVRLHKDSLALFNGSLQQEFALEHHETPITFFVGSNNYGREVKYQYYLEGEDSEWSNWTDEPKTRYTSLFEGKYTFMVVAKNVYGQVSPIEKITFHIKPPWYRTYMAYAVYVLAIVGLIWLLLRWNSARLKDQNAMLERLVKERTAEIQQKNEEITAQAEVLKEVNTNIRAQNVVLEQQQEEIIAQSESLKAANDMIVQKNMNITSSIHYAQRIQAAILPFGDRLRQFLPEHFVFFNPRDIVSGDFYWFQEIDEHRAILVVADCTGHGVPGAFMSMLGSAAVSHYVIGKEEYNPAKILEYVDEEIRHSLQQKDTDNKDGMEMAVCLIDTAKRELIFAGAKSPLVYIQDETLHRVKGSSSSIGGKLGKKGKQFVNHTIDLASPTHVYLFSDGYQDQFGGKDNRKFMSTKFREYLFEIHHLEMNEQKKALNQTLYQWMGMYPQVDDITVIGFKL